MLFNKYKIGFVIVLCSLFSGEANAQVISIDSLNRNNTIVEGLKPGLHYNVGSSFLVAPHYGSASGLTFSPYLTIPLSQKLSVEGGIIAGYIYISPWNSGNEGLMYHSFNEVSIFGSASYQVTPRLTLYGAGIKQLTGNSPYDFLPKSSYTIGSTINFGNFSLGFNVHMSKWDNIYNPLPVNGSQVYYSPFWQGPEFAPNGR